LEAAAKRNTELIAIRSFELPLVWGGYGASPEYVDPVKVEAEVRQNLNDDVAAWREKPSWYAVSKLDRTTSPELERFVAERMGATTIEVESGHLSMVVRPREIADLILAASGRG